MEIYIDVFDAAGNRLGDGPVANITSANVTRALDGAGQFSIRASAADPRAIELFTNERRVQIWGESFGVLRLIGEGIIRKVSITDTPQGPALRVGGPDIMNELKRRNTLLARIFSRVTVQVLADALIALVPGWTVDIDASIASLIVDARYDGVSVLKAFQSLASRYGFHLRLSPTTSKELELGPFGADSGQRIENTQAVSQAMIANPTLMLAQNLSNTDDSEEIFNWILPVGAGEGVGVLTLEHSTRITPYPIQNTPAPDGSTIYYISDAASIAQYGEIQKVAQFKGISVLSNTDADIAAAADALYDAAVELLTRHKDKKMSYAVSVKSAKVSIAPGDKVELIYIGQVWVDGAWLDYINVREDFWVLKATESIGLDSDNYDLQISNVDRKDETNAQLVMDTVASSELRNLQPSISPSVRSYVYDREISAASPGFTAEVPVKFTDASLSLQRILFQLKTTPFRTTASAAAFGGGSSADGGDHRHLMFFLETNVASATVRGWGCVADSVGIGIQHVAFRGPGIGNLWTADGSGDHVHDITHNHSLIYGIADDVVSPKNVTVWVDGVDKTAALFGFTPLAPTGLNLDVVADSAVLTSLINNAAGGLRQDHTIEIRCADQQGRVEATVEIFEVNQAVRIV